MKLSKIGFGRYAVYRIENERRHRLGTIERKLIAGRAWWIAILPDGAKSQPRQLRRDAVKFLED